MLRLYHANPIYPNVKRAMTFDFFTMWILNSVDSDEPMQLLLSLGTLNWCSVSSLTVVECLNNFQRLWSDCAYFGEKERLYLSGMANLCLIFLSSVTYLCGVFCLCCNIDVLPLDVCLLLDIINLLGHCLATPQLVSVSISLHCIPRDRRHLIWVTCECLKKLRNKWGVLILYYVFSQLSSIKCLA